MENYSTYIIDGRSAILSILRTGTGSIALLTIEIVSSFANKASMVELMAYTLCLQSLKEQKIQSAYIAKVG